MADKNRELVDKLKKYNQDLDKYMPNLNFDFLKDDMIFDEDYLTSDMKRNKNSNSQYNNSQYNNSSYLENDLSTLVANNVIDVKSEIGLLRKNILENVSSIVLRTVSEQNGLFLKKQSEMLMNMNLNFKEALAGSFTDFYSELSSMKKDIDKIVISNQNLISSIDEMQRSVNNMKLLVDDLNDFKKKMSGSSGFEGISKRFSIVEDRLSRVISNNELQLDKFVTILKNNNDKIDSILDNLSSKSSFRAREDFKESVSSNSMVSSRFDERLNRLLLDEDSKEEGEDEFKNIQKATLSKDNWDNSDLKSSASNYAQFESKLKKLNSLR